ncbi:MAG: relaxase/mobilization nuclease domain-containing protein, partial [Thermoleophilia bacterium]|nr:relaxase/mobilization nuclease domain-containing protein [Thermoleophilia bacterium]
MIAVSSSGRSFRALAAYLVAGRSGEERDRVAWSIGRNLPTDDPELAARFMRATASQNDRVEKPVYHIALSFDPNDPVDRAAMERVANRVLERL